MRATTGVLPLPPTLRLPTLMTGPARRARGSQPRPGQPAGGPRCAACPASRAATRPAARCPLEVSEPQPVGRDPAFPQQTRHQPIIGRRLRPGTQGTTRCSSGTPGAATSRSCRITTTAGTLSPSRDRPGSIQRLPRFPGISRQCEHTARLGNRPPHVARTPIICLCGLIRSFGLPAYRSCIWAHTLDGQTARGAGVVT